MEVDSATKGPRPSASAALPTSALTPRHGKESSRREALSACSANPLYNCSPSHSTSSPVHARYTPLSAGGQSIFSSSAARGGAGALPSQGCGLPFLQMAPSSQGAAAGEGSLGVRGGVEGAAARHGCAASEDGIWPTDHEALSPHRATDGQVGHAAWRVHRYCWTETQGLEV